MRWKGFILFLMLLLFFNAPVDVPQTAAGSADIPRETLPSADPEEPPHKYVALTFDDGPRRSTTIRLLDGLQARGASATFFLIGQQIHGNEDLLRRMREEGHQVGNHTYSHVKLAGADQQTILTEIGKTDALLRETLGEEAYWLRPPYGLIEEKEAAQVQVPMIRWSVDPEDWKVLNADKEVALVRKRVEPGAIILMHDFYPSSVDAALRIVDELQAGGYTFVTVKELFALYGTEPLPGGVYTSPHE